MRGAIVGFGWEARSSHGGYGWESTRRQGFVGIIHFKEMGLVMTVLMPCVIRFYVLALRS